LDDLVLGPEFFSLCWTVDCLVVQSDSQEVSTKHGHRWVGFAVVHLWSRTLDSMVDCLSQQLATDESIAEILSKSWFSLFSPGNESCV